MQPAAGLSVSCRACFLAETVAGKGDGEGETDSCNKEEMLTCSFVVFHLSVGGTDRILLVASIE